MTTEILGVIATYGITLLLAWPLSRYIVKVFRGERTWSDFMAPLERLFFKISGINPKEEMNWKEHLKALLTINLVWFVYAFFALFFQDKLPLNPDGNPGQSADLAFNTAISFVVNCNLQHYSGETGVTYFTQLFVLAFLQFVSAATGIAALIVVFKAMKEKTTTKLGNFWDIFLKTITRILLPISIVIALIFVFNGMPASYAGKEAIVTMQGDTVNVSHGPVAGFVAIKHLGTNGGGWFGANSAHPLENPNYVTWMTEMVAQVLIPIAMVFALGMFIQRKKFAMVIFGIMTIGMICLLIPSMQQEMAGNPAIAHMGIQQATGAMEGKEVRFGAAATGYWSTVTTIISTGSVCGWHDSTMPMTGMMQLLGMMLNCFYGGCGVGILNYYIFIIIAVFISGLMVGRTPEFMGHKLEAREVKIAAIITLLSPFLILAGTALSSWVLSHHPDANWAVKPSAWLNNPGYHGFSEMLYEYTSANANNGSGFEGLGDGNVFWNVSTGFILILGRFLPIIGPVAIAGLMASKKYIPESAGTLKTDSLTFGAMTFAVIVILTALSYFPALALGPIAEYFSL
ncbi:K+-transporting ATPase ATPase A chain [Chitinophaga ginsengisegetis]|uniref:Potassium-transporting ATPase potassium-binding subunit n=1 Tax=Chitinophaga ginsengisegetis TaxID=393003 RepID=A0A1T5P731_9BACT|nr:potassium-transporting ATPase subunit KdpA [Chitinophaga ginsengisegetis]MDR6566049.1 K+-transporting ATPase ATPase A chain [Chitinophaga ginsengisegetis]MDR6645778.1 K+-transporting ATPase ATPase A chain [Chitinophaga ginsengisegetis]MDR6651630.1 K+-transporting ATPase ATPase A chain [Chitinophaga ginsengisegetis]SKD08515.1 K+-transporting ATPase ATPase A chain [Chitinophaga ginsengisegetis]